MSAENSKYNYQARILVVDDKEQMRDVLRKFLLAEGYEVDAAANGSDALKKYLANRFDLVLTDIKMPTMEGTELLAEILKVDQSAIVILMTAFGSIEAAVGAIKDGATDYISKPFQMEDVLFRISRALKERVLERRVADLEAQVEEKFATRNIIGQSPKIKRLKHFIERIAPLEDTVLITGETGTGKELVARALHLASRRNEKSFVAIDCSSIPETLIEAELFGHEKGAFTGATESRAGFFETVGGGTLFLDEVESLSLTVQAKLLRVLQEKQFRRVGGRQDLAFRARVVAATNQDLRLMIEKEQFRSDLFYRLNVLPVEIPPLRERREDLPEIIAYLLAKRSRELAGSHFKISPEAMQTLIDHEWKGNVRELENTISYVTALGGETIGVDDLPFRNRNSTPSPAADPILNLAELEKRHILRVLGSTNNNRVQTAKLLGIDRRTLFNKLRQYGFE